MTAETTPAQAAGEAAVLAEVLRRLRALGPTPGRPPRLVNLGHGRDPRSRARAAAFLAAWPGEVGAVVSWPEHAASWLRPARRLAAGDPDAWVIADLGAGWNGLSPRLAATATWRPTATVTFPGLNTTWETPAPDLQP